LYEWLRNREPRWATLAIIHRLDKETSGIIVFLEDSTGQSLAYGTIHETRDSQEIFVFD